jgi:two-component system response regulator HydG
MSSVLVVDDDDAVCELIEARLAKHGYEIVACTSAPEALEACAARAFDAVVTDLHMNEMNGLDLCERVVSNRPGTPVIVMTAHGSMDAAVLAMRARAIDFVTKPIDFATLRATLERALLRKTLEGEVQWLRSPTREESLDDLVGVSPSMKRVGDLLGRVVALDTSVLLCGESGTGKSLAARTIHERSHRRAGPFVAVDCAAVPETLLETELFGHAKGAFTDAKSNRVGLFLQADRGTLFLDEVGEIPLRLQPKLLRVLQERVVRPVGSDKEIPCDVRLIAATNRDLDTAVAKGTFREDLFYRINVVRVELPPLRRRGDELLVHAQRFLEVFASVMQKRVVGLSPSAAERLLSYSWPGNIRELQNAMERAVALTQLELVTVDDLPDKIRQYGSTPPLRADGEVEESSGEALLTLEELEARHIRKVLDATAGNKTRAAEILGVHRRTLYRRGKVVRGGTARSGRGES